jgi:peptidylprolyl isomerase
VQADWAAEGRVRPAEFGREKDETDGAQVEWGSQVWLEYEAFLDSGRQIDVGVLGIRVGHEETLPGLGPKLLGLREGDERLVRLAAEEAFGQWDLRAVLVIRKGTLSNAESLPDGATLEMEIPDGTQARCRVYHLPGEEERVSLDFNHPLAGEPLTLFVRVAAGEGRCR